MAKRNAQPTEPQPLENLDAALADVPSNAHASEPGKLRADHALVAGTSGEKPTKKPRTASPVQLASRAFQRMCDLQAQRAREAFRHAEHVAKTDKDIAAIEAELDGMPEVRRLFEGLRAAAEGAK